VRVESEGNVVMTWRTVEYLASITFGLRVN
jgi:hypothetical protein